MTKDEASNASAFMHEDDGQRWLRVMTATNEWDEPISGWALVFDLTGNGSALWRHVSGIEIRDEPNGYVG